MSVNVSSYYEMEEESSGEESSGEAKKRIIVKLLGILILTIILAIVIYFGLPIEHDKYAVPEGGDIGFNSSSYKGLKPVPEGEDIGFNSLSSYKGLKAVPEGDICFNSSDPSSYENYTIEMEEFIKPYREIKKGGNVINCLEKTRTGDEVCIIDSISIHPCGSATWGWGFRIGKPCVILYYSDDPSYVPIPYETIDEIPPNVPKEVREIAENEPDEVGFFEKEQVRLHCTHVLWEDYYPVGFYDHFFPNSNVEGYLPPMAAVIFKFVDEYGQPKPGEYDVECSLWSKQPNVQRVKKWSFTIKQDKEC